MIKKFLFLIVLFFAFNGIAFANFPPDAKTAYKDVHTGTSGILLNSVSYDRTALYAKISCATVSDCAITIDTGSPDANDNNILDTEGNTNDNVFISIKIPANKDIYWHKKNANDKCNFTLVYTDYNLSLMGSGLPSFYNGGDMFISLILLIGLSLAIVISINNRISRIKTYKEYTGVNEIEGKQHYKI